MFFRNLTLFRFPLATTGLFDLEEMLQQCALKELGAMQLSSRGFVSPFGRDEEALHHQVGQATWLAVGGWDRLLPPAVVNEYLAKKLAEIEEREGRKPSGRTRKRIKDDVLVELIPKAFIYPSRTDAYLDLARGFICVDASGWKTAENVISEIRRAMGSFPALRLNAEVAPRSVLTAWLAGEPMPDGWALGEECELRDVMDGGAVVRIQNEELETDEVRSHLETGKQCTRLGVIFNDHLSFVIGDDLSIRKLKFLDGAVEKLEDSEREDLRAELDARFALMAGEVGELFESLEQAFKLSRADEGHVPSPSAAPTAAPAPAKKTPKPKADIGGLGAEDHLYESAVVAVRESGRASISHVQRVLKIGYNRAARLLEAMEDAGVVSVPDNRGDRKVLPQKRRRTR